MTALARLWGFDWVQGWAVELEMLEMLGEECLNVLFLTTDV